MVDKIQGLSVLRNILKEATSLAWFLIVADEAIDVVNSTRLNLSIHGVSDDYEIHTDSIALCIQELMKWEDTASGGRIG